jgi:hypothetical protein
MGTIVSFRIGQNDVESLGKYFHPTFDSDDLLRVPNHNTIVRTLIGGIPTQPFSMATLPPLGTPRPRLAVALKQLSSAKFGRPRSIVEAEITKRMTTKGALPAAAGLGGQARGGTALAPGSSPNMAGGTPSQPKPAPSGSSFLDDWLSKRQGFQTSSPSLASPPAPAKTPPARAPATPPTIPSPHPKSPLKDANAPQAVNQPKPPQTGKSSKNTPAVPTASKPATSKNISSDELAKHEVDQIAAELKQELNTPAVPDKLGPDSEVHPNEGDTIVIDHDGSFHLATELKKKTDSQATGNA